MALGLIWVALQRHPFSTVAAVLMAICTASLFGVPVPLALGVLVIQGAAGVQLWYTVEPFVARRLGCRAPTRLERERLGPLLAPGAPSDPAATGSDATAITRRVELLVLDAPAPWLAHGLRTVVVSRAMLDLLEDRSLLGLLTQAMSPVWSGSLAGELLVWIALQAMIGAWLVDRLIMRLGRLLAALVGWSLVLPLLLWPEGFVRWVGRVLGAFLVGILGVTLVSGGLAGAGVVLLVAWTLVPGVRALLAWERRRTEALADQSTIDAGLGWHLLEALETLVWLDPSVRPNGLLGWLARVGAPVAARADRIWKIVAHA